MFADVIVNKPQDPKKNFFTYKIPSFISKDIKNGHLVEVPWGKKTAWGIVFEVKDKSEIPSPKEISQILLPTPLLLPYQIKLLKWMSWYYHAPMLDCLKAILPEIPKKATNEVSKQSNNGRKVDFSQEQLKPKHNKNELALLAVGPEAKRNSKGRLQSVQSGLLADENKNMRVHNKQTIILVPNINQIPLVLANLDHTKNIIIYHSELKPNQRFEIWLKLLEGNFDIIIGSRSAIFVPCNNLSEITIHDEHSEFYKDQRSPYFNAISVALTISRLLSVKLSLESPIPDVETFYFFQKNSNPKWNLKMIENHNLQFLKSKIKIVNILDERKLGNYSIFSDTLKSILIQNINNQKRILLYLNRKIEAGYLFCPQCLITQYSISQPILCPNCQNPMVKFYSQNLGKVKKELQSFLPQTKVSIVEADLKYKAPSQITIATSAIFYGIIPQKFDLIGVIWADTALNFPDFRAQEHTFQTLWQLSELISKDGQMIIQTANPQNPAIKFAAQKKYQSFVKSELLTRRQFSYPPYSKLVKIILSAKNSQKALEKSEDLIKKITGTLTKVEVLGPTKKFTPNIGKISYNIILKSKSREDFQPILEIIPLDATINIDPKDTL